MRLSIHLNPFATMRNVGGEGSIDLLKAAVTADLAGADGVVLQLDRHGFIRPDEVRDIRAAVSPHLAIEVEPDEDSVRAAMDLHPDQVTIVPPLEAEEGLDPASLTGEVRDLVRSMQAAGIEVAVLLRPAVSLLKDLKRLGADFVVLDSSKLTSASSPAEELEAFEALESAALAANKLQLRVIAKGSLDHRTAGLLASLEIIEELVLDHRLFARAFLHGLDRAVAEYRGTLQTSTPRIV
jgi:pyridoxine 5'-phosphate synthase PdxJ